MFEVELVSEICVLEGERLSGNESEEVVDEIEDYEVDVDVCIEEVSYMIIVIYVKSYYLIVFL